MCLLLALWPKLLALSSNTDLILDCVSGGRDSVYPHSSQSKTENHLTVISRSSVKNAPALRGSFFFFLPPYFFLRLPQFFAILAIWVGTERRTETDFMVLRLGLFRHLPPQRAKREFADAEIVLWIVKLVVRVNALRETHLHPPSRQKRGQRNRENTDRMYCIERYSHFCHLYSVY